MSGERIDGDVAGQLYTIQQASAEIGVSPSALRRLCNSGLIPRVRRNKRGFRVLAPWQLNLAVLLLRLRQVGFNRTELKRFARLTEQGEATLTERKAILETQKRQLWQELEDRQHEIDLLERQIELLDKDIAER